MTCSIGIIGYSGRMGQAIARLAEAHEGVVLVGGLVRAVPLDMETQKDMVVTDRPEQLLPLCDVVLDFSNATASADNARLVAQHGKAFVCGITGLDDVALAALREASKTIPVLYASNTSLSLVVMKRLVKQAAHLLRDHDYDIAILDRHHRWKKDAPSGTAKTLGEAVRQGNGGSKEISYAAIRAGAIVGEHEVSFTGQGETVTLQHSVTDRAIFARGALEAALWLHGKENGLYSMDDVLNV